MKPGPNISSRSLLWSSKSNDSRWGISLWNVSASALAGAPNFSNDTLSRTRSSAESALASISWTAPATRPLASSFRNASSVSASRGERIPHSLTAHNEEDAARKYPISCSPALPGRTAHCARLRYAVGGDARVMMGPSHGTRPIRPSVSRRISAFRVSCAPGGMCWQWHPPQTPKCGQKGMLRSGEEESSRSTRPRTNFFLRWMGCTETSSPGRTKGTKTACPSWCARPSPPYTSFSMRTSMTNGMSPRPPRTRPPAALDHVEQAQPRQSESFEQAFLQILPLDLRELCRRHLPPVGGELAVEFSARRNQRLFAGASRSRRRKFFFQSREAPLEILQIERRGGIEEHANFLEPCADSADSQCQLRLPFPLFVRRRRQLFSVALHIGAQFFSRKRLRPRSRGRWRRNVRPAARRCLLGFLCGIEHRVHAIH